jgi:hypothetical protein
MPPRASNTATRQSTAPLALLVAALLLCCGCTLIGRAIGARIDAHKPPKRQEVARGDVLTLKSGDAVEIQLWDGRRLTGRYLGLQWARPETYNPRYEAARDELAPERRPPALGPGARLVLADGKAHTGDFQGLGPGFVRFVEPGKTDGSFELYRIVTLADASGREASGGALGKLVEERRLPTLTGLELATVNGNQVVDYGEVAGVSRLVRPGGARSAGTTIGALLDVAVVAMTLVLATADYNTGFSCPEPCNSCPLVDSFDGTAWVADAEPLGGAFYRAAERTDVARLDHIRQTHGGYRVRVRNEQQEIDHLDAVALRVVDHPLGTEIVPDALGRLHAVRDASAPIAGRALPSSARTSGGSVVALVARADGEAWVSDGRGRDPALPGDWRDGVELEFPRPPGARSALLVARVGATRTAPALLAEVLALQGRDLGRFYAGLEEAPGARQAFEQARDREVLPTVRVFDDGAWRVVGRLRDLPSLVLREEALPFELPEADAPTLRLRIDGAAGLFAIDRVRLSFEDEAAHVETRVAAASATTDAGRDVLELLGRRDQRRHSLRPHLDAVTLTFPAPPLRPGRARTVLLEATGYYNLILRADGEPRPEAFRQLVREPGAVARFALERLNRPGG